MEKSQSIANLAAALAKFQGEVRNAPKSADNPYFKSKYTPLDVVVDHIRPILEKNGLSYIQSCGGDGAIVTVTTLIMHSSGEWIETEALSLKADKMTAQGAGSAITYARRYALTAAFGIASDEDDDGNIATGNHKMATTSRTTTSYKCTDCGASVDAKIATRAKEVFGVVLCGECGKKKAGK